MKQAAFAIVTCLLMACALPAAAQPAGNDYELWESVTKMTGSPEPATEGKKRICQKPAGESEMQDLGAIPKHCQQTNVKRNSDGMTFEFSCDESAAMKAQMKAIEDKLKGNPAAVAALRNQPMPKAMVMTGVVESRRIDPNTIEQQITMKMPSAQPMVFTATGKRIGSCRELTFPPKPAAAPTKR